MFHGVLIIWMFTACIRCNMHAVKSQSNNVLLATGVTPHISNLVKRIAEKEELYVSEWIGC